MPFCRMCGQSMPTGSRFCGACGADSAGGIATTAPPKAATPPIKRQGGKREGLVVFVAIIATIIFVVIAFNQAPSSSTSSSPPSSTPNTSAPPYSSEPSTRTAKAPVLPPEPVVPPSQKSFTSMIDSFIPTYNAADTEIRKTDVRFRRKNAIADYFSGTGSPQFLGWVGEVDKLTTEQDGEAYISIKLHGSSDIHVQTWNNSLSDSDSHTMISRNDPLYQALMDVKTGDIVTVSGMFFLDRKHDFVTEGSLTENGSMTEPEFIVKFSQISKGATAP
jgi:hypothetical protein